MHASQKDISFACLCATACVLLWRVVVKNNELDEQIAIQERLKKELHAERKGRTKAEQRLRQLSQQASLSSGAFCEPALNIPAANTSAHARADGPVNAGSRRSSGAVVGRVGAAPAAQESSTGLHCRPIGFVRSPFHNRCGTPRQSGLVSSGRSTLEMLRVVNPSASLDGMTGFSHLWVIYVFHENTNFDKEQKVLEGRKGSSLKAPPFQGMMTKITPPRCPDLKVGVFSCRSPHRPNPIGLSLAEVVEVNAAQGTIVLQGLDLLDGTPVLDIKPYLPQFENKPDATVPDWVRKSYSTPLLPVEWAAGAREQLDSLDISLGPFESTARLCLAIEETLSLDIRSPFQKKKHQPRAVSEIFFEGDLHFQGLKILYSLIQVRECNSDDQGIEDVSRVLITNVARS